MKMGLERGLREKIPEIVDVVQVRSLCVVLCSEREKKKEREKEKERESVCVC